MATPPEPAPGEGPVRPVSVSLHEGTIAALKARTGKRGMSAYVEALIQRQLERGRLRELIEDAEAEHGPVDQAAVESKRALLRGDAVGSVDAGERHPRPRLGGPVQTRTTYLRTHRVAGRRRSGGHPRRHQLRHPRRSPRPRDNQPRFDYAISRVNVIPPTEAITRHASRLLAAAGLHGHKYALDAIVDATAMASPAPVTVLTSDPEDLHMLCGRAPTS